MLSSGANNPKLGISEYDYHYKSCRCVYCNEIVIINPETLDILLEEEVARLRAENAYTDYYYLTAKEEREIRDRLEERYRGSELDYDQCIHDRCWTLLQLPENQDTLRKIRLANRQNMILPDCLSYNVYPIDYTDVQECLNLCIYCHNMINEQYPGFAYCLKSDKTRRCRYIHVACYEGLMAMRRAQKEREAVIRRNFMHLLSAGFPDAWQTYSVRDLAMRNDAWYEFLSRYPLTFDEREVFKEWLDFITPKRIAFRESELVTLWIPSLRYPDISLIVADSLSGLSYDQLGVTEGVISALVNPPSAVNPIPSNCSVTPEPCYDEDGFPAPNAVRYGAASPTNGQPPLLYLNLVQTLIQSLTPSSFSLKVSPELPV